MDTADMVVRTGYQDGKTLLGYALAYAREGERVLWVSPTQPIALARRESVKAELRGRGVAHKAGSTVINITGAGRISFTSTRGVKLGGTRGLLFDTIIAPDDEQLVDLLMPSIIRAGSEAVYLYS